MNDNKKLEFVQKMAGMALEHAKSVPNVPTPDGKMSHDAMQKFLLATTKHGLQHFDDGGTVLGGPSNTTSGGTPNTTGGGLGSSVSSFLGTQNNFQAQGAPIQAGTNAAQLNNAYTGNQNALNTQGQIAGTLDTGLNQGAQTQSDLTAKLTAEANGQGPNPAQAALNASTGQNINAQASLMAGQRGSSANPALAAKQAAEQGAATQQQAVGQGATLQAQQQLAAQQQLQNLASTQVGQGQNATNANASAQQGEQTILQGANSAANNANVSMQGNINNNSAGISEANQKAASTADNGLLGALSNVPIIGSLFAKGGVVKMAEGGLTVQPTSGVAQSTAGQWLTSPQATASSSPMQLPAPQLDNDPGNAFAKRDKKSKNTGMDTSPSASDAPMQTNTDAEAENAAPSGAVAGGASAGYLAKGGRIIAKGDKVYHMDQGGLLSELGPLALLALYHGGMAAVGGNVKAKGKKEQAKVSGDSYSNDKIPTLLSEDEIVIPRHITMSDRAPEKAAEFVRRTLAKKGK